MIGRVIDAVPHRRGHLLFEAPAIPEHNRDDSADVVLADVADTLRLALPQGRPLLTQTGDVLGVAEVSRSADCGSLPAAEPRVLRAVNVRDRQPHRRKAPTQLAREVV